jgi:restriction endonuclease S subunit
VNGGNINYLKKNHRKRFERKQHENLTSNDFLYYLLKDNIASLHSASYGAVFDTITKETFSQIVASIPPLPEQQSIASILSRLDDRGIGGKYFNL